MVTGEKNKLLKLVLFANKNINKRIHDHNSKTLNLCNKVPNLVVQNCGHSICNAMSLWVTISLNLLLKISSNSFAFSISYPFLYLLHIKLKITIYS